MRTKRCSPDVLRGRLAKAEQFWEVAGMVRDLADEQDPSEIGDAYVTLCVHAGIAAADALCCAGLVSTRRVKTTATRSSFSPTWTRTRAGLCGRSFR